MQAYYCPKCGSEDVIEIRHTDSPAENQTSLFCENCHRTGTEEEFSKKPYFWNWRFWRVRPIPALLAIGLSLCIPASGTIRIIVFIAIYALLSSRSEERRVG